MNATRRLSIAALVVACLHLVFGAIVRISGSGMGCGDHWPKCYGYWFPPFNRPDLIVEVSHRYLASILTLTVLSMAFVAWRNRGVVGVGGKGGAMRSAFGAVAAVFSAAILGGVTVKMGNAPWATVAHWLVAMTLLAMVATTAIRAGALGGASSLVQRGTHRARRSGFAAALLAIFAVALGGLTAKYPGAAVGCTTVPMCGPNPSVETASVHVQLTHRTLAVLLVLHLIGVVMMVRKRRAEEAPVVVRAAYVALGMVLLQLVVASSMVLFHLPPVLRSLHEATGVGIWLSCFTLAYLARRASRVTPPEPATLPDPSPKGGLSIVREPVAAPSVIAAGETIVASASVVAEANAAVVEDVATFESAAVVEEGSTVEAVAVEDEVAAVDEAPIAALPPTEEVAEVEEGAAVVEPAAVVEEPVVVDEAVAAEAEVVTPPEAFEIPEEVAAGDDELPPALAIVAEAEIVEPEPEPPLVLSEAEEPAVVDEIAEADPPAEQDATAEAAIVAELILAIEDAAKEAAKEVALERAEALAREAALASDASEVIVTAAQDYPTASEAEDASVAASFAHDVPVIPSEATAPAVTDEVPEIAAEETEPSVITLHQDDMADASEELDWEPRPTASEELDEFSIAALEAEQCAESEQPIIDAATVEPEPLVVAETVAETVVAEALVAEPVIAEPVAETLVIVEETIVAAPVEQITADASIVTPSVKAPRISPVPAPTMAVLVARGADFL